MDYLIAVYTGRKIYTLGLKPGMIPCFSLTQDSAGRISCSPVMQEESAYSRASQ